VMLFKKRDSARAALEEFYVQEDSDWCDLSVSPAGALSVTLVSEMFEGQAYRERREGIRSILESAAPGTSLGFLSLHSPHEAKFIELERPISQPTSVIATWHDLAHIAANGSPRQPKPLAVDFPRTIVFYSFKGGVGRTTALLHVAAILAQRGRKVVAVDLDLEAPGLGASIRDDFQLGLVDYLYERVFMPHGSTPSIHVADLLNDVEIPKSPGRLFVVPAGRLSLDYISKVDELRTVATSEPMYAVWQQLVADLTDHINPDLIFVDSRTGINEWGALSTFRAADETIVFLFPNDQNVSGVELVLEAFRRANLPPVHVVFSPVPDAEKAGMAKVRTYWERLQNGRGPTTPTESEDVEDGLLEAEPLVIPYLQPLALADAFPMAQFSPYYAKIANLIDSETVSLKAGRELVNREYRWEILESLNFPYVSATDPRHKLDEIFQKTADFDRFLDPTTCLVRGRKGTGKSALYWYFLNYPESARKSAHDRLASVRCMSGHGRYRSRPSRDEFRQIDNGLKGTAGSWETVWRGYLLLRLKFDKELPPLRKKKFEPLSRALKSLTVDSWQSEHTRALLSLATHNDLILLAKDALDSVEEKLRKKRTTLWILYDDLDEDLADMGSRRSVVLTGLFQLLQSSDAQKHPSLIFKVFIREDVWAKTIFDNRSHFNGRDILLQWSRGDFLRLSLRLALRSIQFEQLVSRLAPVEDIDTANEQSLEKALQILWGSRREAGRGKSKYVSRWIYERLTDSSGTTFPRSLSELLTAACRHELDYKATTTQAPEDRLLRAKSLNNGLSAASQQRCNEVREEYPELNDFFENLREKSIFQSKDDLQSLWETTAQAAEPELDGFLELLEKIGLVSWRDKKGEERYRFADLYIDGFKMNRSRAKI
jgi:MinD-like ATPase involved in chromosome partitioning or flagellar assembly